MLTYYNTIEDDQIPPNLPAWSSPWPANDGCPVRTLSHPAINTPGRPAGGLSAYDPERVDYDTRTKSHESGKRRGFPPFRYTNYNVAKKTTKQFLIRKRQYLPAALDVYYQTGHTGKVGASCAATPEGSYHTGPRYVSYYQVLHDPGYSSSYITNGFDEQEILAMQASIEDAVSVAALTSFDALTELAELRDIPRLVTSTSRDVLKLLSSIKNRYDSDILYRCKNLTPKQLLKSTYKVFRKLGTEWMTYRYGLMPLIYSYRDAIKLVDRCAVTTTRKSGMVLPKSTGVTLPGSNVGYNRVEYEGSTRISGNVFQAFQFSEIARLSSLGMNPAVTAWELIPYSFVADWFVNAGDYIARKTGTTLAGMKWACLSRRDQYTKTWYAHIPSYNSNTVTISNVLPAYWVPPNPTVPAPQTFTVPEGLFKFKQEEVNSYSRWVFLVNDARLVLNPSLKWRRLIDSAVISTNLLDSFMRNLRKGLTK